MSPIISLRSHLLTSGALPPQPATSAFRGPATTTPDPIALPDQRTAPRQPDAMSGFDRHMLPGPPTTAEAAAAAARRAYISASIAAGVSPLPLPGH